MEFISTQNFASEAERVFWDALKTEFAPDTGFAWHRYPITSMTGPRLEPDIVILHPDYGLNIIEVKGCRISNIEAIEQHTWYMTDWDPEEMEPYEQAEKHMWAILDRMKMAQYGQLRTSQGNCKVAGRAYVGLPFVTEQEWRRKFGDSISAPKWELIFSTDLHPRLLREKLAEAPLKQHPLTQAEWNAAVAFLRFSGGLQKPARRPTKRVDSKAAYLRKVEQQMTAFDLEQHRVAIQIPSGPQRIRGLAGTGKTVVLAQKAAYMHVKNPTWDILFTFNARSLYAQVKDYITRFVQEFSHGEIDQPDWDKLHVLHGWGGAGQPGWYRTLCDVMQVPFRNYTDAMYNFATMSGRVALNSCFQELLDEDIPELFDAILVDEAQDFGENLFRVCYRALRQPKRLIWGYDEVQSLEELEIPTAETLFGKDTDGKPLVDLSGTYPGEIPQDLILYHCYRNPRPVLVCAHAFGLGLLRKGGAVQFIDTVGGWQDIGYEIKGAQDGKLIQGQKVTLCRPQNNSPHLLEQLAGYKKLVSWKSFTSRQEELDWIVEDIVRNTSQEELRPDEIVVVSLDSRKKVADSEYAQIFLGLQEAGINSIRVGTDSSADEFRRKDAVTITSTFRAKGNEASLVYVYGFEYVAKHTNYDVVIRRNLAFTAMTRTKGWLVLTGVEPTVDDIFLEIEAILEQLGCVSFVVPDMAKIQRNLETYENQRRRDRTRKAEKTMAELIKNLADVDPKDLSEEQKKQLFRLLFDNKEE